MIASVAIEYMFLALNLVMAIWDAIKRRKENKNLKGEAKKNEETLPWFIVVYSLDDMKPRSGKKTKES